MFSSLFPQSGPHLPPFKTLLLKGSYHPSAPIHLSISHVAGSHDAQAVLITPSRQGITLALQEYDDDWIALNSDSGRISDISSRVKVFYPPSPAHLCLLLSMLQVPQGSDAKHCASLNSMTTLAVSPSLVILHEPSMYFLSRNTIIHGSSQWTVSSYLTLITHTLSSLTFLSRSSQMKYGIAFALFDSQLDQLKLPMWKQPVFHHQDTFDQSQPTPRLEPVAILVERYFEWMGVVDQELLADGVRTTRNLKLFRVGRNAEAAESWQWSETPGRRRQNGERRGAQFFWDQ